MWKQYRKKAMKQQSVSPEQYSFPSQFFGNAAAVWVNPSNKAGSIIKKPKQRRVSRPVRSQAGAVLDPISKAKISFPPKATRLVLLWKYSPHQKVLQVFTIFSVQPTRRYCHQRKENFSDLRGPLNF